MALTACIRGFSGWVDEEQMLNFLTYATGETGDGDGGGVQTAAPKCDLRGMNRKELLHQAKQRGIKNVSQLSKPDLLNRIESTPFTGVVIAAPVKKRMTKIEKQTKAATKQMRFIESSQSLVDEFPGITTQIKDRTIDATDIGFRKLQTISKLLKINCLKMNAKEMLEAIQNHLEENPDTIIELNVEEISQPQIETETPEDVEVPEDPEVPEDVEPESPTIEVQTTIEKPVEKPVTLAAQKRPKNRGVVKQPVKKVLEDDTSPPADLPKFKNFGCLIQSSDTSSDSD